MKILNGLGTVANGALNVISTGFKIVILGISIGALSLVLLVATILYTMF